LIFLDHHSEVFLKEARV